jgi:hypothetical protein
MPSESSSMPSQTIHSENPPATSDNSQPQTPDFVLHPLFLLGVGALIGGVTVAIVLAAIVLSVTKRHKHTKHLTEPTTQQTSNTVHKKTLQWQSKFFVIRFSKVANNNCPIDGSTRTKRLRRKLTINTNLHNHNYHPSP